MEALAQNLSERIIIARRRLKMTQTEFAAKLRRDGFGVRKWTAADISELENERMDPRLSEIAEISHATGLDLRDLISDKPLYLGTTRGYEPTDDLHPVNIDVTDSRWFHRDELMHLTNPDYWTKPLQSETLPIRIAS
jgi:transcriptional regulator with XRE-family HTH domain